MSLRETLFCFGHPMKAIETKTRQIGVAIEAEPSPVGSTIEEFPNLPISKAAALVNHEKTRQHRGGGIQLEDWSESDQKRLLRGEKPQGVPTHRDV